MDFLPNADRVSGYFLCSPDTPATEATKGTRETVSELKSGDRVVAAGMVGTIITVKDDSVTLRTGESKIEVVRTSVERVITDGEGPASLDLNKK